eukprot:3130885-Rhodomonas_salina.1
MFWLSGGERERLLEELFATMAVLTEARFDGGVWLRIVREECERVFEELNASQGWFRAERVCTTL